ncbi:MAG: n-acetylglutamate synthase [Bacteroidota bacterium]
MSPISYDGRQFRAVSNAPNSEVSDATRFAYRQRGDVVWATYEGGGVRFGTLVASVDEDGCLDMRYAHVNTNGDLMTGTCRSTSEVLPDGRLRLHEHWQWTSGDGSAGTSVVEEIVP